MDPRAKELVTSLKLAPHPEGGWYREIFRSAGLVHPQDGRPSRQSMTSIYFLLQSDQRSRWHKVLSDEAWIWLEGAPLDLWQWDVSTNVATCATLGPLNVDADVRAQHVIPAGQWQAARPKHKPSAAYTLVTCVVAPAFDFADFSLMTPGGTEARLIGKDWPELVHLI